MSNNNFRKLGDEFIGLLSAFSATETVRPLAEATMSVFADTHQLRQVLQANARVNPAILQGRALEFLEVLKFNRAAAEAGSSLRATTTHFSDSQAPADVLIRNGSSVVKEVQAKSYSNAATAARELAAEKYQGMDRLVPKEQSSELRALLDRYERRYPSNEGFADIKSTSQASFMRVEFAVVERAVNKLNLRLEIHMQRNYSSEEQLP